MQTNNRNKQLLLTGLLLSLITLGLVTIGCTQTPTAANAPTTQPSAAVVAASTGKSGAQLWAETCMHCHNLRTPPYFSADEWDVVVHHMRVRANLTGEEQRKITEFLKASN